MKENQTPSFNYLAAEYVIDEGDWLVYWNFPAKMLAESLLGKSFWSQPATRSRDAYCRTCMITDAIL